MKLLPRRRAAEDRDLTRESLPSVMLPDSTSPDVPGVRSAAGIADVFACVRVLVDGATMAPLHSYRRTDSGRERVEATPAAALLERPAPGVTQPAFVGQLVANLALWGECFVGLYYAPDGSVAQLAVLSPDRMEVEIVGGEPRFKYHQGEGRIARNLTLDDVIHIRSGFTLDGVRGVSPIRMCRESMGLSKSLTDAASALWANGAVPGGILTVPSGAGGDDQAQALADGWSARHQGAKNRGRIAVVTGEVNWQPTAMPLTDAEFIETRKLSTAEIARIMRVPVWMIGAAVSDSSLTYATVSEQANAFVKFSLGPWLRLIEEGLSANDQLFPQPVNYCRFSLDGLLRAEPAARAAFYTAALAPQTGWMTRAEVRALEDLPAETPQQQPKEAAAA
jgi:HK97 family phage portal protein